MALNLLTTANALNPGADLWIIPDPDQSHWSCRLDWYMNFQVSRSLEHKAPEASKALKAMVQASGTKIHKVPLANPAPSLIATRKLLPNLWTLCLPYEAVTLSEWVTQLQEQARALGVYRIRVFFPKGVTESMALTHSKDLARRADVTYLVEH